MHRPTLIVFVEEYFCERTDREVSMLKFCRVLKAIINTSGWEWRYLHRQQFEWKPFRKIKPDTKKRVEIQVHCRENSTEIFKEPRSHYTVQLIQVRCVITISK